MNVGDIISADRVADAIEVREITAVDGEQVIITLREVAPDDDDWLAALAALPPETPLPQAETVPLDMLKARARQAVLRVAGQVRQFFVSDIPGQDMVYLRKEASAREWISHPAPDLTDFPLLAAETGITASTPDQLAQLWLNMAAIWVQLAAFIEHHRFKAALQIEMAEDAQAVEKTLSEFNGAMASLLP